MNVASRVAKGLSLVAGDGGPAPLVPAPLASPLSWAGDAWAVPGPAGPTLAELFPDHPREAGWMGFLLPQIARPGPLLWIQDRMAILEGGRVHPPGLGVDLVHVETRDARDALWTMEEGLRCAGLSAVVGEIWGDPAALDFTASRRLAVAAERNGVAAFLIRLGGHATLSGARMRWRIASRPSLANPLDRRAPGPPAWDVELFRARGCPPGRWSVGHDPETPKVPFRLVADAGDRTLDEDRRIRRRA